MNFLYRAYASNNPAGIQINLGVYALAECICTNITTCAALQKWCGISEHVRHKKKRDPSCTGIKTKMIMEVYKRNNNLPHKDIAELVGCTREMVSIVLRRMGLGKRNRWDGYISKDPRYSIKKRKALGGIKQCT